MHPHFLTRFCPLKKVLEAKIKTRAAPGYWQREPGQRRTAASRPVRILNSQCPGKCARNYNKYLGESAQERERAREREGGRGGKRERASERERDCDIASAIKSQHQRLSADKFYLVVTAPHGEARVGQEQAAHEHVAQQA